MTETEIDTNDEPVSPSRPLTPPEITRKEGAPKRTHVEAALDALKKMTLAAKLSWNMGVEERNEARGIKRLKALMTPATRSAAATVASDDESYLTIVEAEAQTLEAPGILARWSVPKWIDEKITSRLLKKEAKREREKRQKEEREERKAEKRKAEEEEEKAESKAAKLRKSRYHAPPPTIAGSRSSCQEILYPFPDLLHQTASHSRLPMSVFTNKNLKIINESIGVIPRTKLSDESMSILNFNNPSKLISCGLDVSRDEPLDPNPHTWREIHTNHHRFQLERDPPGLEPENGDYWTQAYTFVLGLPDFENNFPAIVATELETRLNRMNIGWTFDQVKFENVWVRKLDALRAEKKREEEERKRTRWGRGIGGGGNWGNGGGSGGYGYGGGSSGYGYSGGAAGGSGGFGGGGAPYSGGSGAAYGGSGAGKAGFSTRSGGGGYTDKDRNKPFQSGSSGSPSTWRCIICSARGHSAQYHDQDPSNAKALPSGDEFECHVGNNGKSVFNKRGAEICINWNLYGDSERCNSNAALGHNRRKHLCSFCGKADHWAFSWTCQKKPKGGD